MNKKQEIEKTLKRYLKRKISITKGTITTFLITGLLISSNIFAAANFTDGNGSIASSTDNVAIVGKVSNSAGGQGNVVVGSYAKVGYTGANIGQSIAIGGGGGSGNINEADATYEKAGNSTPGAWARGDQSISIGGNTVSWGHSSIAIGGDDVDSAAKMETRYTKTDGTVTTGTLEEAFKNLTGGTLAPKVGAITPQTYISTISKHAAIAMGAKTKAGDLSVSIGTFSNAETTNSVALGSGAKATKDNSVAIGGGSETDRAGVAQTSQVIEGVTFSWAGGDRVLPGDVVSFGKTGYERQLKNVAPGQITQDSTDAVNGSQLYGIADTLLKKMEPTYFHTNYNSTTQEAGNSTTNKGTPDTKAGALGAYSLTAGVNTKAEGEKGVSIGYNAYNKSNSGISIGNEAGKGTANTGTSNIYIGKLAGENQTGNSVYHNIAIGENSGKGTTKGHNISLGYNAGQNTNTEDNVSIGQSSSVSGGSNTDGQRVAIGGASKAANAGAVAIGAVSNSTGINAVTIGKNASASGVNSTALGAGSSAAGSYSIAMGDKSNSANQHTIAMGYEAKTTSDFSVAIGGTSNASVARSVALGYGSTTKDAVATNQATVGPLTYNGFAGSSPDSVVSFGTAGKERQLQNVAAGQISKTSTDAINGSQLYATNNALGNLTNAAKTILGGNAAITSSGDQAGKITMTNIGDTGKNNVNDAIKAAKTEVTGTGPIVINPVTTGSNGQKIYNVTVTKGDLTSASPTYLTVTDGTGKLLGGNASIDLTQATKDKIDNAAKKDLSNVTNDTVTSKVNKGNLTSANPTYLTVTNGTGKLIGGDASIDLSQDIKNKIDNAAKNDLSNLTQAGKNVINNLAKQAINVVEGTNTHVKVDDKANGTKTFTVHADKSTTSVSTALSMTTTPTTDSTTGVVTTNYAIDLSKTTKDNIAAGKAAKDVIDTQGLTFTGDKGTTGVKKLGSTIAVTGDANIKTNATSNGVELSLNKDITIDSVTVNNGPTINNSGINMNNKPITNLAPGQNGTDAVNKNQLDEATKAAKTEVTGTGPIVINPVTTGSNGQKIYNVTVTKGDLTSASPTYLTVTDGTGKLLGGNASIDLTQATKDKIDNAAKKDLSNVTNDTVTSKVNKGNLTSANPTYLTVTNGTGKLIGGDASIDLSQDIKNKIDNAAKNDLSNLTQAGNNVINNLAKQAITVVEGTNTHVKEKNVENGLKTFTVHADKSTTSV
ncbi:hypothetical protein, partial [Streptobacillus felis]